MAARIKIFEPIYLHRYRSLRTQEFCDREMMSIRQNSLWCSNFKSLNDPMEGSYRSSPNLLNHGRYRFVQDQIFDEKSALGICSFSETHDNGPMWAHYADQFGGICIAYSFRAISESLGEQFSFVRVSYEDDAYLVTQGRLSEGEIAQKILSSKSHRWLYEREWRLFGPAAGPINLPKNCISRVYLGNRMTAEKKAEILAVLRDAHIEAHTMELEGYRFGFSQVQGNGFATRPALEDELPN